MILIDGNNLAWKSYYAAPLLQSRGRSTGVLHCGLTMLLHIAEFVEPDRVVFLWDSPSKSWRSAIYPLYKQNRKTDPFVRKSVHRQIVIFKEILDLLGISHLTVSGLEADDLAGCFSNGTNHKYILVSGDKDWFQLLTSNVRILRGWDGKNADWWDAARLEKEYGFSPKLWPYYLALIGDKVDNIPNVRRGMGPVTAKRLLVGGEKFLGLNNEEMDIFKRNIKLTMILRSSPKAMLPDPVRRPHEGWVKLSGILRDYELHDVRTRMIKLFDIGGWNDRTGIAE